MGKKKTATHALERHRSENLTDWNFCFPSWLKKKKTRSMVDTDSQGQMEAANTLLLLKYGYDDQTDHETSSDKQVPRRRRVENLENHHPNPVLPLNFKTKIHELTGSADETEIVFVFEKTLFKSDVSVGENRFLIPFKKIKNEFLTEEEKRGLETTTANRGRIPKMEVDLIQPCLEVCSINLKKWNMGDSSKNNKKKKKKKTSENYVLVTSWNKVVNVNELTVGSLVQLWSFRKEGQLCLALVKVDSD